MDFIFTKEQEELKRRVRECAEVYRPYAAEWDRKQNAPMREIIKRLGEYGLLALTIPKEYGGQDKTCLDYVLCFEEARLASDTPAVPIAFYASTGPGPSICMRSDSEHAKRKFMPAMVRGEAITCICLTEPKVGTGLTDLETSASLDGDYYIVNGQKCYAGLTAEADFFVVFVRFDNIPRSAGIGAIMIEKGTPGMSFGKNTVFMGLREYSHQLVILENCRVPKENLLFGLGQFKKLMGGFNMERMGNAIGSVASAQMAFDFVLNYVQERKQFGRDVIEFQAIQQSLADMYMNIQAARCLVYRAAANAIDGKYPRVLDVTAAKVFANQVAVKVTQEACWLAGGFGVSEDSPLERYLRLAMISPVAGGTRHILGTQIIAQLTGRKFSQRKA